LGLTWDLPPVGIRSTFRTPSRASGYITDFRIHVCSNPNRPLIMTEYDYSPDAYERHLDNMHRIENWVDQTEQQRPQFSNAAALTLSNAREQGMRPPPPPPLNLPQHGYGMQYPYAPPPPSASSCSEGFAYASAMGSPGPMPTSFYQHQFISPTSSFSHGTGSSRTPYPRDSHKKGSSRSHGHGLPTYMVPPPPILQYPAVTPGYMVTLPMKSGRKDSRKRSSRS